MSSLLDQLTLHQESSWSKISMEALSKCPQEFLPEFQNVLASFCAFVESSELSHKKSKLKNEVVPKPVFPEESCVGSFGKVSLAVPRLSCAKISFFSSFFRFETKSENVNVAYSSLKPILILPQALGAFSIALCFSEPINESQSMMFLELVLKPKKCIIFEIFEFNASEGFNESTRSKLALVSKGSPAVECCAKVFSAISNLPIMQSVNSKIPIDARVKVNPGNLYLFETGVLFFPTPCSFIPVENMHSLKLDRAGLNFMELKIKTNIPEKEICYEGIDRTSVAIVTEWVALMTKKIRPSIVKAEVKVENIEEKADSTNATVADMSDDSSDDSEFEPDEENEVDEEYDSNIEKEDYQSSSEESGSDGEDNAEDDSASKDRSSVINEQTLAKTELKFSSEVKKTTKTEKVSSESQENIRAENLPNDTIDLCD